MALLAMSTIIQTLFPVFAVIALSYGLARRGFLTRPFLGDLNRLVYYVSLPALIVHGLASTRHIPPGTGHILLIFLTASSCVIGIAYAAARLLGLPRTAHGTFVQASLRGNLAFISIPILSYALRDEDPALAAALIAQAIMVFAPVMIFYNVMSVTVLVASHHDSLADNLPQALRNIARNPLIIAACLGMLLMAVPGGIPFIASSTLEYVGRLAGPGALMCVGGSMAHVAVKGRYRSASVASLLKTGVVPLLAWLISIPFALDQHATLVLMVLAAAPTAVASYVLARELHGDEALAASAIVISTLLSTLSLAVVVGLF
jgi:malate permease and related proteins